MSVERPNFVENNPEYPTTLEAFIEKDSNELAHWVADSLSLNGSSVAIGPRTQQFLDLYQKSERARLQLQKGNPGPAQGILKHKLIVLLQVSNTLLNIGHQDTAHRLVGQINALRTLLPE